jgi:MFS family permease
VILTLMALIVVMTAGVATADTVPQMMVWRLLGGAITGGPVPIALALLGDIFPND